jgi:hypothetical protein
VPSRHDPVQPGPDVRLQVSGVGVGAAVLIVSVTAHWCAKTLDVSNIAQIR